MTDLTSLVWILATIFVLVTIALVCLAAIGTKAVEMTAKLIRWIRETSGWL